MNEMIKEKLKSLPDKPGVYMFRDAGGDILYIGKARSLRKRVKSYFNKTAKDPKIIHMLSNIDDFDFILLKSEDEALLLEDRLVKEYKPKYNADLKDDKRYPMVKVTVNEAWPRILLVRQKKNDGARYFGPYTDAKTLRRMMKFVQVNFRLRRCRPGNPTERDFRHCLYYHLGQCMAPCINKVSPVVYQDAVSEVNLMFSGMADELIKKLNTKMRHASRHRNYEKAAKYRDFIADLEKIIGTKVRKGILKGPVYIPAKTDEELKDLAGALGLEKPPVWIDAFDVSNLFGKDAVGSLVRFRNGLPYKNGYRRFKIKTVTGIDDYAMMNEIVDRRYKKGEYPDLILIDGGRGQLEAARKAVPDNIKIAGLAKRFEEIFLPGQDEPLRLPKESPALKLLQRVRDEAHRFAVGYHRNLRSKGLKK